MNQEPLFPRQVSFQHLVRQLLSYSPIGVAQRTKRFTHSIEKEEPQSVGAATFSLIKAIAGSGVLAMPAGLAASTDAPKA